MIAVAFALPVLVTDDGLMRTAFSNLAAEIAEERGLRFDEQVAARAAAALDAAYARNGGLDGGDIAREIRAVLDVTLDPAIAEARLRMAAAVAVSAVARPFDDTAATLREIASLAVPRAILTGGWSHVAFREAEIAGFDGTVLVAEDLGVAAGTPAAYAALARAFSLPADHIWIVGSDERREIAPARAAGCQVIRVDRTPGGARSAESVARLDEILTILSGPYTRSLLAMRDLMRTVLDWRQGHFLPGDPPAEPSER